MAGGDGAFHVTRVLAGAVEAFAEHAFGAIIGEAERASAITCERCSEPGVLHETRGLAPVRPGPRSNG